MNAHWVEGTRLPRTHVSVGFRPLYRVCLLATLGILSFTATASAQNAPSVVRERPDANWSVIRQGAPDIVLPSDAPALEEATTRPALEPAPIYEPVILRGAIGHVPSGEGTCTIDDGRYQRVVTYTHGLPTDIRIQRGDAQREITRLEWNPEDVQLLKERHETQTRGPASRRGDNDAWTTANWFVRTLTWDEFRRPHTFEQTQEGGARMLHECTWESRRKGRCSYNENLQADVELTVRGEVKSVQWSTKDRGKNKRALGAMWQGDLLTRVIRSGELSSVSENFRYDEDQRLVGFDRRQRVLRGKFTLRWRLQRDAKHNVTRVERRCFGACSGMRSTKIYTITYDDALDNTFCGAWWDDGIDPTLHGW